MSKKLVIVIILILAILGVISYIFISPLFVKEEVKIILEEDEACPSYLNLTFTKGITISYKASIFRISICKFPSVEDKIQFANSEIIPKVNETFKELFDNFEGFLYDTKEQKGIILSKENLMLFCIGYVRNLDDTKKVCEWFIKNKLSGYI